jgi:hypothetical protein
MNGAVAPLESIRLPRGGALKSPRPDQSLRYLTGYPAFRVDRWAAYHNSVMPERAMGFATSDNVSDWQDVTGGPTEIASGVRLHAGGRDARLLHALLANGPP